MKIRKKRKLKPVKRDQDEDHLKNKNTETRVKTLRKNECSEQTKTNNSISEH